MFQGRPCKDDFDLVLDRIDSKLAAWKGRLLNKPGRVTLANSVLAALPTYNMQVYKLPHYIGEKIDSSIRSFIWKGAGDKGMHMVSWNKITQARKDGGLGVRRAKEHNTTLLGKLVWNLFTNKSKLWVQVLGEKYLQQNNLVLDNLHSGSPTWNAIKYAFEELQDCSQFKVGRGDTSFWYDSWAMHRRLADIVDVIDIHDTAYNIRDLWNTERNDWQLEMLYTPLPSDMTISFKL